MVNEVSLINILELRREASRKPILPHPKFSGLHKPKRSFHNKLIASINLNGNPEDSREGSIRLNKLTKGKNSNSSLNLTSIRRSNKENVKPNIEQHDKNSTLKKVRNNKSQSSFRNHIAGTLVLKESNNNEMHIKRLCRKFHVTSLESVMLFPKLRTESRAMTDLKLLFESGQFICDIHPALELFNSLI